MSAISFIIVIIIIIIIIIIIVTIILNLQQVSPRYVVHILLLFYNIILNYILIWMKLTLLPSTSLARVIEDGTRTRKPGS